MPVQGYLLKGQNEHQPCNLVIPNGRLITTARFREPFPFHLREVLKIVSARSFLHLNRHRIGYHTFVTGTCHCHYNLKMRKSMASSLKDKSLWLQCTLPFTAHFFGLPNRHVLVYRTTLFLIDQRAYATDKRSKTPILTYHFLHTRTTMN